jgi:hypothetical protein
LDEKSLEKSLSFNHNRPISQNKVPNSFCYFTIIIKGSKGDEKFLTYLPNSPKLTSSYLKNEQPFTNWASYSPLKEGEVVRTTKNGVAEKMGIAFSTNVLTLSLKNRRAASKVGLWTCPEHNLEETLRRPNLSRKEPVKFEPMKEKLDQLVDLFPEE